MEATETYGWRQLRREGQRSAESYGRAFESDLSALEADDDRPYASLEDSLIRTCDLLARDVTWLQVEGKFDLLDQFHAMVVRLLRSFPRLARLRDLPPRDRVGCRLDAIAQDLEVLRSLPSRRRTLALFDENSKGAGTRRAVMQCLAEQEGWIATRDLKERLGWRDPQISLSRQGLHNVLRKLRDHGLVLCDQQGAGHYYRLSLLGSQLWRELEPAPDSITEADRAALLSSIILEDKSEEQLQGLAYLITSDDIFSGAGTATEV